MPATAPLPADVVLRGYFHAKDENRPHLLDQVFSSSAVVEVRNSTSTIAFPAATTGRESIGDVLVREFGRTYENVYSFYLGRPGGQLSAFECEWVVVMTEKASRNVRIGCGRYEWEFEPAPPRLARRLVITIAEMLVLPASTASEAFDMLGTLTYPWSSRSEFSAAAARHAFLAPIVCCLRSE